MRNMRVRLEACLSRLGKGRNMQLCRLVPLPFPLDLLKVPLLPHVRTLLQVHRTRRVSCISIKLDPVEYALTSHSMVSLSSSSNVQASTHQAKRSN